MITAYENGYMHDTYAHYTTLARAHLLFKSSSMQGADERDKCTCVLSVLWFGWFETIKSASCNSIGFGKRFPPAGKSSGLTMIHGKSD